MQKSPLKTPTFFLEEGNQPEIVVTLCCMENAAMSAHVPFRNIIFYTLLCLLFGSILLWSQRPAYGGNGGNGVSGRYLSSSGKKIVLSLKINSPSPTNLIVKQNLSKGNIIKATSPPAKKIDQVRCEAKWLLRNQRKGRITLVTHLQAPLKGQPTAIIRYHDPKKGGFTELRIHP